MKKVKGKYMSKYFKVYRDYTNYIPIEEHELEKAMRAFQDGAGAVFENGATSRIEAIIPDDNRIMGWNPGYKPTPEEQGEISRDPKCVSARRLMSGIKEHIALGGTEPYKQLSPVVKHTKGMASIGDLLR